MRKRASYDVLVVEDNEENREVLRIGLGGAAMNVVAAADGAAAINAINAGVFDAILLDLELPCVSGMEVLAHAAAHAPTTPVIILTGATDVRTVVAAMHQGAHDYLTKPFNMDALLLTLERAFEYRDLKNSDAIARRLRQFADSDDTVIGVSAAWTATLDRAREFARSDLLIFLSGETGSGKEVLAQYIHRHSPRKDHPFVVVDCGAIPDSLVESELFGHERGAFTGAESSKEGLVELAHGGTLFLDEIGHIDPRFQQKILKFVETKSFRRVGDTKLRSVDVRIIAATNKSLPKEIEAGRFRSDLWYRLNVMKLEIPPLRQRPEDIPALVDHICRKFSHNGSRTTVSAAALEVLRTYAWPGNVRELQSTLQRALAVSFSGTIEVRDLGLDGQDGGAPRRPADPAPTGVRSLREVERAHIANVLRELDGNVSRSAKALGIGRTTLHAKIKDLGITPSGS